MNIMIILYVFYLQYKYINMLILLITCHLVHGQCVLYVTHAVPAPASGVIHLFRIKLTFFYLAIFYLKLLTLCLVQANLVLDPAYSFDLEKNNLC